MKWECRIWNAMVSDLRIDHRLNEPTHVTRTRIRLTPTVVIHLLPWVTSPRTLSSHSTSMWYSSVLTDPTRETTESVVEVGMLRTISGQLV